MSDARRQFRFGIYPGALLGDEQGILHPVCSDDPRRVAEALDDLQGTEPEFLVRVYRSFASTVAAPGQTPEGWEAYLGRPGRKVDLVLQFREPTGSRDGWERYVRGQVRALGAWLGSVQICEEPNADLPVLDGSIPGVREALVAGVVAAKEEVRALGLSVEVGFNAVPSFGPAAPFWDALGELADARFLDALDYVGLDFFPDVFTPVPAERLADAVAWVLHGFRRTDLPRAGIPAAVPIRICENGWPTGPGRSEESQARVLETVIRAVAGQAAALNLDGYTLFALRDADSRGDSLFHGFGLLRDDHTRKAAFETYRRLIAELGPATRGGSGS
ncbi:hypothetical protein TR51_12200 [Kitasatospora griseola]|uniref:Uncharacterized protein n=1 Tax=Kitasatospora griseola TaxID=2064 RepID=A0A0D0PWZ1_KITGR|nr:hypothetical protein [Kitasatospora griseola]KIQ64867.1 hypothetical protein TR51_12200 [Kitasatospora griseola]